MRKPLPSLNAIRAFEAAARLGSFTKAGEELGVTSAAVGQQVRSLEAHLNTTLFHRHIEGLEPTTIAKEAVPVLTRAFDQIAEAMLVLDSSGGGVALRVSVPPSFGVNWLAPRLPGFYAKFPGIEVSIDAGYRMTNLARGEADVAIRFGSGRYANLVSERILDETIVPLCSPELRERYDLQRVEDLERAPLVHLVNLASDTTWPNWRDWAERHGLDGTRFAEGPTFFGTSGIALVLRAVAEGQGVALCGVVSAIDDIRAGRLVAPLGGFGAVRSDFGYDLLCSAAVAQSRPVSAFRTWIKSETQRTSRLIAAALKQKG